MARVTFSAIVGTARGKVGSQTFSRTRGGDIVRKCPIYVQPLTADVLAVRALMRTVGAMWWNTLSESQRLSWRSFGQEIQWRNCFNEVNVPAGSDLFTQCNINSLAAGGSYILHPPLQLIATDPGQLTCSATEPSTLTVTPQNPLPAGYGPILRATTNLNPGWYFFNKYLRQLGRGISPPLATTLPDASNAYARKFGHLIGGRKVGLQLQYVNLATGAISAPQSALIIVGSAGDTMFQTTVPITSAQLLALNTTPVQLLPPPGAGFVISIMGAVAAYKFGTVPYTVPSNTNLELRYTPAGLNVPIPCPGLLDQSVNTDIYRSPYYVPGWTQPLSAVDNNAVTMGLTSGKTLTLGDGTLEITIIYIIAAD